MCTAFHSNSSFKLFIYFDFNVLKVLFQLAFTSSKLTIETLEQGVKHGVKHRSGVFIAKFEHILHLVLVFILLTLSI